MMRNKFKGYSLCIEVSHVRLETFKKIQNIRKYHSIITKFERHFMRRIGYNNYICNNHHFQGGLTFVNQLKSGYKFLRLV